MNRGGMRNYGPAGYLWELWHEGPIRDRDNVVLVHGFRLPLSAPPGRCDEQFGELDKLVQAACDCNVWQFEYVGSPVFGTHDSVGVYASRLDAALNRISEITGNDRFSMIGYSMGGIIARKHLAMGGRLRVDKLMTLATPHLGVHLEPIDIPYTERFYPRGGLQMRADSRFLWDLNTDVESSSVPEFASLAGHSLGKSDGAVEVGATSLVKCARDGSVERSFYFAGVHRSHLNINRVRGYRDEVFRLAYGFLKGGVSGLSSVRSAERPGDYLVPFFLTFAVKRPPEAGKAYPYVETSSGRCYRGPRVWSQGALTDEGAQIYTVRLRAGEEGEACIFHAPGKYTAVRIESGQSVVVPACIDAGRVLAPGVRAAT